MKSSMRGPMPTSMTLRHVTTALYHCCQKRLRVDSFVYCSGYGLYFDSNVSFPIYRSMCIVDISFVSY